MSEWITDRKPTEQDGDEFGHVYNADLERVMYYESSVRNGKPWCKVKWVRELPEPYQPPEPDTSLSASIERMTEFEEGESGCPQRLDGMSLWQDDLSTILEAARKWDKLDRQAEACMAIMDEKMDELEDQQEPKPDASYPVRLSESTGVWMASVDNSESAARRVAVDCMLALGFDPSDFKMRDKVISAIADRVDGMLNYVSRKCQAKGDKTLIGIEPKELARLKEIERKWMLQQVDDYSDIGESEHGKNQEAAIRKYVRDGLEQPVLDEGDELCFSCQDIMRDNADRLISDFFYDHPKDPSMAVSPGENCGAEGQAETQPRERSSDPQDKLIEHGTSSGDKPWHPDCDCGAIEQAECVCFHPCVDEPKRREWTVFCSPENVLRNGVGSDEAVKVREVLPDDPDPEWVDELIRLCDLRFTIRQVDSRI